MMTLAQLRDWLAQNKNSQRWIDVARRSGVPYNTIARVARGAVESPGVLMVERICKAISDIESTAAEA